MGTTIGYVGIGTNEEYYNNKFNLFVQLSPVVELGNTKSMFLKYFCKQGFSIFDDNTSRGFHEFFGKNWYGPYGKEVKSYLKPLRILKKSMIPSKDHDDPVSSKIFENHFPHGASIKTIVHLGTMVNAGKGDGKNLSFFDWHDEKLNMELYGSKTPPIIDIFGPEKIPMVIFAGVGDKIVNIEDVRRVKEGFKGNLKHYQELEGDHLSFFIGKDMTYVDDMITQIKKELKL